MKFRITAHAAAECERRAIAQEIVEQVLDAPEQILQAEHGRKVHQSRVEFAGKLYLIRVIVEEDNPAVVVTVYRTSKIEKYWRES